MSYVVKMVEMLGCELADQISRDMAVTFEADIPDASPKLDLINLELPIYGMSAKKTASFSAFDKYSVIVKPGLGGQATMRDKQLLSYCISQLVEGLNRGRKDVSPRLRITPHRCLVFLGRPTTSDDYDELRGSLERLKETSVLITVHGDQRMIHSFSPIQTWTIWKKPNHHRGEIWEVELPRITFLQLKTFDVLTLDPSYRGLPKIKQRLYEIARKHCGTDKVWRIRLALLYERFGPKSSLNSFRHSVKQVNEVLEFSVQLSADDQVIFKKSGQKTRSHERTSNSYERLIVEALQRSVNR